MGTAEEAAADDILVGAQARIMCWTRARSSSELVDTATARRRQREADAAHVELQFPFRSERRGRGAPSVALKWRDNAGDGHHARAFATRCHSRRAA